MLLSRWWWWVYDLSNLVFGVKASYKCIRLLLRCVGFIVNWITGHFHVLITSQTRSEGWVRSNTEALTTRPANEVLRWCSVCCLLVACMYVCVFDFGYHYALLYQGFFEERVIFLDISSCSEPEMRARQILREIERERERKSVWSNSNTDAAAVDLSIFVRLMLLLRAVLQSTVSSCFFKMDHRDGESFK